jgi:hypothetical protein
MTSRHLLTMARFCSEGTVCAQVRRSRQTGIGPKLQHGRWTSNLPLGRTCRSADHRRTPATVAVDNALFSKPPRLVGTPRYLAEINGITMINPHGVIRVGGVVGRQDPSNSGRPLVNATARRGQVERKQRLSCSTVLEWEAAPENSDVPRSRLQIFDQLTGDRAQVMLADRVSGRRGNSIGRLSSDGVFTNHSVPSINGPDDITVEVTPASEQRRSSRNGPALGTTGLGSDSHDGGTAAGGPASAAAYHPDSE